ncbi:cysteine-rich CWC family protein [Candidatus Burkholderia verschuerenii]|uniref:cysteine-rich CWC family protein n=1 Tax=Candidatus Burkholderia verschuerenii TaxID=242163 RepID=UPI00067C5107|nr:cysteine-rich CWC family protein [Candidatus Burkholderia verschuerenii]
MMNEMPRHDASANDAASHCERCGATFRCGARAGDTSCWCAALPALPPQRLRDGAGCLCAACLAAELTRASREN